MLSIQGLTLKWKGLYQNLISHKLKDDYPTPILASFPDSHKKGKNKRHLWRSQLRTTALLTDWDLIISLQNTTFIFPNSLSPHQQSSNTIIVDYPFKSYKAQTLFKTEFLEKPTTAGDTKTKTLNWSFCSHKKHQDILYSNYRKSKRNENS